MDLIVFDVLCRPGAQVRLRARLERRGLFRRPVAGRPVLVRSMPAPGAAGAPHDLAELTTDADGYAEMPFRPPAPGHHFFEMEAPSRQGDAGAWSTGLVACRTAERPAVVLDIDGTLTSEGTTLRTGAAAAMIKDRWALAAVHQLAAEYDLLYLTGRRRQLVNLTRDWLIRQGLPVGPLFLQMSHFPVPGFLSGMWKRRLLSSLRARHPNVTVGIGNTRADASAYAANGMLPLIFTQWETNAVRVRSWDHVDALLLGNRLDLRRPVQVTLGRGRATLELRPDGDNCSVSLRLPDGPAWEPPPARWPTLRTELLNRLRSRKSEQAGNGAE